MEYSVQCISKGEGGGRSFVGVSNIKDTDKTRIVIPYGFILPRTISEDDTDSINQLKRFVKAIQKALLSSKHKKESIDFSKGLNNPIAAVNIIHDFLSLGFYVEYDTFLSKTHQGKIDFKRTIKRVRPELLDDRLFYNEFICKRTKVNNRNLISTIQGNIINHFMSHGGDILFGQTLKVKTPDIELNSHTVYMLRKEQQNTFNSRKQSIIQWSIEYINSLLNPNYEEKGEWNYAILASSLWEIIVDSVFGNHLSGLRTEFGKEYYSYSFDDRVLDIGNKTIHDTIIEEGDWLFIVDSKMYDNQHNLLTEDVLGKQFGYYLEAKKQRPHSKIVNILMLPHISGKEGFQNYYIPDPHTSAEDDPDKLIFVYTYSVNTLIDEYYFGIKQRDRVKKDFLSFIAQPHVNAFMKRRGVSYSI